MNKNKKILVTGAAGFIGFHVTCTLLKRGENIIGIDNINDYYDINLKKARLAEIENTENYEFIKMDILDRDTLQDLFTNNNIYKVVHLAAQAGVRYSLKNPYSYTESNITGFINILECCRHNKIEHLVYASSSSVYGSNTKMPFSVHHNVDHPVSLYAATKKANELMAHTYSHLYQLPTTGLRFFTVYGPWGRPDMALFLFTKAIINGEPIDVYNHGNMSRDFTYIDDIVSGVVRTLDNTATPNTDWDSDIPDTATSKSPYRIYNIGSNSPVKLLKFIEIIEEKIGKKANKNMMDLQPGDVPSTFADVNALIKDIDYRPSTSLEHGVGMFVDWYRKYYNV